MLNMKTALANKENYGGSRNAKDIKYIVFHYTGNDGDSDESNARYFQEHIKKASAHFFVDDDSVTISVPELSVAWSVGGEKYPSCGRTGGGKWNGKCTNFNSISIELCDTKRNGTFDFTEATLDNAAELCRMLMKKYGIPIENVIRHFDVVGKFCPAPFLDAYKWERFKERIVDEVKYYENINEVPTWAKHMIKDMIQKGCFANTQQLHLSDDMLRTMALMQRYNNK